MPQNLNKNTNFKKRYKNKNKNSDYVMFFLHSKSILSGNKQNLKHDLIELVILDCLNYKLLWDKSQYRICHRMFQLLGFM